MGKVVAGRTTGVVDEAIVGILGYGARQFRQIVLLPWGKFEAFLAAKTEEGLAILRDLFNMSIYGPVGCEVQGQRRRGRARGRAERDVCPAG